jgi:hypothetical protein
MTLIKLLETLKSSHSLTPSVHAQSMFCAHFWFKFVSFFVCLFQFTLLHFLIFFRDLFMCFLSLAGSLSLYFQEFQVVSRVTFQAAFVAPTPRVGCIIIFSYHLMLGLLTCLSSWVFKSKFCVCFSCVSYATCPSNLIICNVQQRT